MQLDAPMFVHTCMASITEAGDKYGLQAMQAKPDGPLRTLPDGTQSMQIRVQMIYPDQKREATIVCTILPDGRVQVTTPSE